MIDPAVKWTVADASDCYEVERWGDGYFSIGEEGNLRVHPDRQSEKFVDLKLLVERAKMRGLELPVLFRFNGILKDRLRALHDSFQNSIRESEYQGSYRCVYPIKVNQQREVVHKIVEYGAEFGFGLEAGSKPELLAVVAIADPRMPIICNGFKDDEFVEMALLAQKLGRTVIPVVEKYSELELVLQHADRLGVRPQLGVRVKLASRGSGRWQSSGGYRSKFGLTVSEVLQAVAVLENRGMADCFQLLHFHLGSQITSIRQIKSAINEAARVYVNLFRRGLGLQYIDVGGGLGVDYDGSQTNFESSMNYTLQEYANDVVHQIKSVCDDATVPHPTIISESGRAIAAYHSVLVFETLGVTAQGESFEIPQQLPDDYEQPLHDLLETHHEITGRNVLEAFHDAQNSIEMAMNLFAAGYLTLEQRVLAENLFFAICRKVRKKSEEMDYVPEDLLGLDRMLSDNFFCNFSLFQSMPDSWAISQVFPVMPIHRLNENPRRHAVISDITCDSDGKIDCFVDRRDVKRTLRLHEFDGTPYYLGAFLVGAYQEILGDLHNLFGDTHAIHVELGESGEVVLDNIIKGDTVREVLHYVQFNEDELLARLQRSVEHAISEGRIDHAQGGRLIHVYEQNLAGYTYLDKIQGEQS